MYRARAYYLGGPRNGEVRTDSTPSAQRIDIYEDAVADMTCADEQVVKKLGSYKKCASRFSDIFFYVWKPE